VSERYRGIEHIGIAVTDLAEARRLFGEGLGFRVVGEEEVPEQKVRVVKLAAGDSDLELLESTDPDGPVGRFVAKHGAGIHHVAVRVDDLPGTLAALAAAGVRLIDREPRIGAGGKRIAFIHPRSAGGILIELCESAPETDTPETGTAETGTAETD
jgi:methylmalonyl-CoA epimerase